MILFLVPTRVVAGPGFTWERLCADLSGAVFDDRSQFVATPSCVGGGIIGTTLFVATFPIGIIAAGAASPWGEANDALNMTTWNATLIGVYSGAAVIGSPFYVVKKVTWDAPHAFWYPPPRPGEWRRRPS